MSVKEREKAPFLWMGTHQMTSSALDGAEGSVRLLLTKTHPCSCKCPLRSRAAVTLPPTRVTELFETVTAALEGKKYLDDILILANITAHLTESRVLILNDYDDEPLTPDHIESTSQEEVPQKHQPILFDTSKRTRSTKKTIVQYGRHIYHLDNYDDTRELRSKLKPDTITYDYVDMVEHTTPTDSAKNGVRDYLKDLFILSATPLSLCYGRQCEGDLRKSSKKHKSYDDDETDWKHKKMQLPLGHMKRFQIVDNRHNSVRDPKFGPGEYNRQKSKSKKHKQKYSSGSEESKESGSAEANSGRSHKNKHESYEDSASASFEKWKNHEEDSKSEEVTPKKKAKKKKNKHIDEPDDTKRKTIPVEDTYFMQGNKLYHSNGKSKRKHDDYDKRRRLEHFMPKRYHWDPSEIHQLGYYWFNGPKGLYPEPKVLSK